MTRQTNNINSTENQLNYWRQQLAGSPSLLELPSDRPRPATLSFNRAHYTFILPQLLNESLRKFKTGSESNLYTALLSTFATLLFRYCGQSDILIGSPIAHRNDEEVEVQTGLVNTLVLRLNLSDNPTFEELLSQVKQVTLKAQEHQDIPFEQLVEILQPEQTLSHHPLFQVMFVWQNTSHEPFALSGENVTPFEQNYGVEQLDLILEMCDRGSEIVGNWNYNTDLFAEATIQRMTDHFQTLLEGVLANSLEPIETLPLLTEGERHQLLVAWNETKVEHPLEKFAHNLFEEQVAQYPNTVAVVFGEAQQTYHELNQQVNKLAHYLIKLGVKPEVLVGVFLERSLEAVVAMLAVFKAGATYLPLDPTYPEERLASILEDAQAPIILTHQKWLANLPPHQTKVICLDIQKKIISEKSGENPSSDVTSNHLAYVIYTSGSTGKPKGVLIEHRGLTNVILSENSRFGINPNARLTHSSSLCFDASIAEIMGPLCAGARLYVLTPEQSMPGSALLQLLKTQAITHLCLTPSVLAILSGIKDEFPALKVVLTFGEACSPDFVAKWSQGRRFYNVYGPTEFTISATIGECTDPTSPPPIGRPHDNTQAYLLDHHLQPVPIGIPGELYLGGVQLARGYFNQPALTEQKFIPNPFAAAENPEHLYKTGDLAYYRPDGNLVFVGRVDDMVKVRGLRVELGEIETVLNKHPAVQQAVVVAHKDTSNRNQHLVAYVVPLTSMPTDTNTNVEECVAELSLTSGELSPGQTMNCQRLWFQQPLCSYRSSP
ncbi:amino acid adenylation domain-containing protein [Plectonema radiosum NIES-515]|uniref:Amino acid adenylation domain-containing protein n=1 Tax=Plectonema radiosum NIES-515 TaxID=2986073 RepID=A0ABT3B6H1_9CYAN|nr:amino acid adenylation domain-containing protein [Plectonema radiosum]MCV3216976.1 amino acid adenylation domain-containing protein [Plectonema radiosum NIES-515]